MALESGRPDPFLPTPGDPKINWTRWREEFETWIERKEIHYRLDNGDENFVFPDSARKLDLYSTLGDEGRRLLDGFAPKTADGKIWFKDSNTAFAKVIEKAEELFKQQINRYISVKHFRERKQLSHESSAEYVSELRILAKDCSWPKDREDEEIQLMLALYCKDTAVQKKIFQDHQESDLPTVLKMMKNAESVKKGL